MIYEIRGIPPSVSRNFLEDLSVQRPKAGPVTDQLRARHVREGREVVQAKCHDVVGVLVQRETVSCQQLRVREVLTVSIEHLGPWGDRYVGNHIASIHLMIWNRGCVGIHVCTCGHRIVLRVGANA